MQTPKLVIGSKNSSSWSLQPWLLLKQIGFPFEEIVIPLRQPDTAARIAAHSPSGKVPVLVVGDIRIWDSLAICEFLAEHDPSLWPAESAARAFARSISAEMHGGFAALEIFLPMDFTARFGPPGKLLGAVQADVDRIVAIWTECRHRFGQEGPFLFGPFTIADAMFAPVCSRFVTHAVPLEPVAAAYVERVMALPAMQEWGRAAAAEVAGVPAPAPAPAAAPAPPPRPAPPEPPPWPAAPRAPAAPPREPVPEEAPAPARLPPSFARRVVLADEPEPAPAPATVAPPPPEPVAPAPRASSPRDPPEDIRRALRPIPSTVIVKPIGDGTRRRR